MSLPTFASPGVPGGKRPLLVKPAVAAARLGVSRGSFDKLVASGILPNPTPADVVDALAARPQLQVAEGELTVLRTAARAEAYDADRDWIGFHVEHTDDELDATSLRWWRSDADKVCDNRLYAVTVATIPVAVYEITGVLDTEQRTTEAGLRYHYSGRLLARLGGPRPQSVADYTVAGPSIEEDLAGMIRIGEGDELYERTRQIMASRIAVDSGGPIGYLEATTATSK